jgi:hypothetical protein
VDRSPSKFFTSQSGPSFTQSIKFASQEETLGLNLLMRAKTKNGFPPKVCVRCGLEFEWRKKWARDWENVKYCSERCKAGK